VASSPPSPASPRWELLACGVALVLGLGVRIVLIHARSLWLDEILTLTLARLSPRELLDALRLESNAPLHYLLAKLLLAPLGPSPHRLDFLLRYASLAAALAHLPLLARIARRLGAPESALRAQALFAVAPLAVYFGSEARAYALGSLLVLYAFDQALALRATGAPSATVRLSLASALALLAHLNSLFPLIGLAFLFRRRGRPALLFVAAGSAAAVLVSPWLLVAAHQPPGALAWVRLLPRDEALARLLMNLVLGVDQDRPFLLIFAALGLSAVLLVAAWSGSPARELLGVIVVGLAGLGLLALVRPTVLGPQRTLVSFIPFTALMLAMAGWRPALLAGLLSLWCLAQQVPTWIANTAVDRLAASLAPMVSQGWTVCAVGIYGPELEYKLRLDDSRARVLLFPADVARHRGWHDDSEPSDTALREEAAAITAGRSEPTLFVLPYGARASGALGSELRRLGTVEWGRSAYVEVVALRP